MTPHEQIVDIAKAAPPITITGMSLAGYPMSDWVFALTALYTLLQVCIAIRRLIQQNNKPHPGSCSIEDCPARKQ